ncbi:unnamed protein product [Heligmosomoides polygyrus]|uniref:Lysosomal trafficking regulator lyst n=1 Tax=Heligmosomoides polygyrus TaxID=6339 RepID=A0A183GDV3_HELPZ|nr:unnamed protein product [Heligmosomoides polygyrus]
MPETTKFLEEPAVKSTKNSAKRMFKNYSHSTMINLDEFCSRIDCCDTVQRNIFCSRSPGQNTATFLLPEKQRTIESKFTEPTTVAADKKPGLTGATFDLDTGYCVL